MDGTADSQFVGFSCALSRDGSRLWVGGYAAVLKSYLYNGVNQNWVIEKDFSPDFASSLTAITTSADGFHFVASEKGYNSDQGRAKVYTWNGSVWGY